MWLCASISLSAGRRLFQGTKFQSDMLAGFDSLLKSHSESANGVAQPAAAGAGTASVVGGAAAVEGRRLSMEEGLSLMDELLGAHL